MREPVDGELEVIDLNGPEADRSDGHRRWVVIPIATSVALALVVAVLATLLVGARRTADRLRLDVKAAVADPCHWVDVSDVERATHASMMNTTRTNGTAEGYQQGCVYSLFDSPTPTVIVLVDTQRNPLYREAARRPRETLTVDRMTAIVKRDLVVIVETPNSLNPSGSVTQPLADEIAARLPK